MHFEITRYPCNVIGSQWCDLFTNQIIFGLNRIFFSANENGQVKQNNQSDFKGVFQTKQSHCRKMKDKKKLLFGKIWLSN